MPNIARVTDIAVNPLDVHGKPCCPHPVTGFKEGRRRRITLKTATV